MPSKSHQQQRVTDKKLAFLAAFRLLGSISDAALAATVDRAMHYRWLRDDPYYPVRFESAQKEVSQRSHKRTVQEADWLHSARKARVLLAMHRNHEDRLAKLEAEVRRLKASLRK